MELGRGRDCRQPAVRHRLIFHAFLYNFYLEGLQLPPKSWAMPPRR